jgi:MYXO-CTERM domain-containing protein
LVLAGACLLSTPARAELVEERDETFAGITQIHRFGLDDSGLFQNYRIALVELDNPAVSVQVMNNNDQWKGAKETVLGMANRAGAALAVNGDYWSWGTHDPSQGTTVSDGLCFRAHPERTAIAFSADKSQVEIGQFGTWPVAENPPDDCPSWIEEAVSAGPQFIFDGVPRWEEQAHAVAPHVNINGDTFFGQEAWAWDTGRQPNTAVGITADGKTLILITCDGRGAGGSDGCNMAGDMTDLMIEFGAHNALKLDSGGSTTFFYDGSVRNVASGGEPQGKLRRVVNALGVMSVRQGEGPCTTNLSTIAETVIDSHSDCFERSGAAWWASESGEAGRAWWTWTVEQSVESTGRWRFGVATSGRYAVEAFIADAGGEMSEKAPYSIFTAMGEASVVIDQNAEKGGWVALGSYIFEPGFDNSVLLVDATGEPFEIDGDNRRVTFDALRFRFLGETEEDHDAGIGPAQPDASTPGNGDKNDPPALGGCGCQSDGQGGILAAILVLLLLPTLRQRRGSCRGARG